MQQSFSDDSLIGSVISTASAIASFSLRSFVHVEDKLYNFFKQQHGDGFSKSFYTFWNEFMQFKEFYTFAMILGMLYIIKLPIIGLMIYLNRNCYVSWFGKDTQTEEEAKSRSRHMLCVFILCATAVIMFGGVTVSILNSSFDQPIDNAPNILSDFSANMTYYIKKVEQQLNQSQQMLNDKDMEFRLRLSRGANNNTAIPPSTSKPEARQRAPSMKKLLDDIQFMENGEERLASKLSDVRYSILKSLNFPICVSNDSCRKMLVFATVAQPNISNYFRRSKLQAWVKQAEELTMSNGNERISLQRGNGSGGSASDKDRQRVTKKWAEVKNEISMKLEKFSDTGLKRLQDGLDVLLRTENQDSFLGVLKKYQQIRYFTSTVVIGTAFIVSLMYWLGITLGTVQYHWIPTLRSYVTIAGGKVLICTAMASLVITWILIFFLLAMYTYGCFGEKYFCENLDEPYVAFKFFVRLQFSNVQNDSKISLDGLIRHCKKDHSLYEAIGLNRSNLHQWENTVFLENNGNATRKNANKSTSRRVREAKPIFVSNHELGLFLTQSEHRYEEVKAYVDKLNRQLSSLSLANGFSTEFLRKIKKAQSSVQTLAGRLENFHDSSKPKFERLVSSFSSFNEQVLVPEERMYGLSLASRVLATNSTDRYAVKNIVKDIQDFLHKFLTKITSEVGTCKPIYISYAVLTTLICDSMIDIANGSWLSWLIVIVILIITSFAGLKLSVFYKRTVLVMPSKNIGVDTGFAVMHKPTRSSMLSRQSSRFASRTRVVPHQTRRSSLPAAKAAASLSSESLKIPLNRYEDHIVKDSLPPAIGARYRLSLDSIPEKRISSKASRHSNHLTPDAAELGYRAQIDDIDYDEL